MKSKLIFLICLFSIGLCNAQDNLSFTFENSPLSEVILSIEKKTDVKFFYQKDWLDGQFVSGHFENVSIITLLNDLLKLTNLNFYVTSDRNVVLTKNVLIYDSLNPDFLGLEPKTTSVKDLSKVKMKESDAPIFAKSSLPILDAKIQTFNIGKENNDAFKPVARLAGYIVDLKDGKALANVAINVLNKNFNAETDGNGYYEILLPRGAYFFEIRLLGFETITSRVVLYNNGNLNFELNESIESLDEVIVNSTVNRNVEEIITGVTRIDVEDIKLIPLVLGERDIFKVATTLPGISKTGEGSAGFNVRGGKEDQNLVLLDNAVIYNPTHFFGLFSAVNPFTTANVNIYKGSIPAQFGGRLSSVFDIETKVGNKTELSGEGAVGPVTSNLHIETPIIKDKSSLIIGGRGTYTGWILRSLDEPSLSSSEASFYDAILKYDHKIDDTNSISTTAYLSKDTYSITSDSLFGYTNSLVALKWLHDFSDTHNGKLHLSNSKYSFDIKYDALSNNDFDLQFSINETDLQYFLNYRYNDNLKFNYGLSSKLYQVEPGSLLPSLARIFH